MENKIMLFSRCLKNPGNKKTFFLILIIGAILLLVAPTSTKTKSSEPERIQTDVQEYLATLEKRLTKTLEQVEGAGKVTVLLTPKSVGKIQVAKDTRESSSDTGQDFEEEVVLSDDSPVILEEYYPTIGGAVVVATGAGSEQVRINLKRAASAVLQIGINRIEVLEGR